MTEPAPPRAPKQEQLPASEEIREIAPGVLRMQIPIFFTGLGHVNSYALIDKKGATIVDAGMPGKATWQSLVSRLKAAGLKVSDVHTVVVTHSHPDHFGSAGRLAHKADAEMITESRFRTWLGGPKSKARPHAHTPGDACDEIVLGSADAGSARSGDDGGGGASPSSSGKPGQVSDDDTGWYTPDRGTPWGGSEIPNLHRNRRTMRLARLGVLPYMRPPVPSRYVTTGDHLKLAGREWRALHTPGHTGDHLCLYDPAEGLLISGDHVLPTITPHVPGMSPLRNPLGSYINSLKLLLDIGEVKLVLPAHGDIFSDLPGRIDKIIEHHEGRLDDLRGYLASGGGSVVELSHELFRRAVWGMMAESETYAHLEYLRLNGEATRQTVNGQAEYHAP